MVELTLNVNEQCAGANPEQIRLCPIIAQLLLHTSAQTDIKRVQTDASMYLGQVGMKAPVLTYSC